MFSVVNHFSVVKYNDVEKKPTFEVITSTDDVEYAKKVAFQCAKKNMIQEKNADKTGGDWVYKISTNTKNEHVNPVNKTVQ